jgi:protein-disulfide isomerase
VIGPVLLGLAAAAALAGGQVLQPPAARIYRAELARGPLEIDLTQLPTLGRAGAPNRIVVLSDYTCPHCRVLHANLDRVLRDVGGQVSFTLAPMAMSTRCNPYIRQTAPPHRQSCEYALLALAVWRAKPQAFAEFDAYLWTSPQPPPLDDARRRASQLLGSEESLARAQADPWVAERLRQDIEIYRLADRGTIPKLIFRDHTLRPPEDPELLLRQIRSELGINTGPS